MNIEHAKGCIEGSRIENCFRCIMDEENKKYLGNTFWMEGPSITLGVSDEGKLFPKPE